MKLNDLKRNLKETSREGLIKDILELYRKNDFVKDFYASKYADDDCPSILIKHKDLIENEFFPKRGDGKGRLSVAKKAISEFKKVSSNKEFIAELMIFYVEIGVRYTNEYGDIDEPFYCSMEGMYEKSLGYMKKNNLLELFGERAEKVVRDTSGMGWGFHDQLYEVYYQYY
ncbi:hypothetical protein MNBD_GAMMA04-1009 [hydrothermal vent metagenome]|uniref:Uncharacterized protein n=1 Tax=hydrothermal vent metagenome TaxID=652676 RepID=A0A3B0WC03_9ZZZZ